MSSSPNNMEEDDIDIECGEIELGIPYRKITELKFTLLESKEETKSEQSEMFRISVECKYEGLSKPQQPTIINRTIGDFQWLETALRQHVENRFVILPMLAKEASLKDTLIGYFANKLSNEYLPKMDNEMIKNEYKQKERTEEEEGEINLHQVSKNENLTETMLERYMKLISEITVKNLYYKPNEFENPIFIFIQEKDTYSFYFSLYEKEKKSKENVIKEYFSGLLNYVPSFSKQKSIKASGLEIIFNEYQKFQNKSTLLLEKFTYYNHSLSILSQNFIQKEHRNKIKLKLKTLHNLINSLNYFMKYLNLVIDEISYNMQSYDSIDSNSANGIKEVEEYAKRQISEYSNFVSKEKEYIESSITKISQQFIVETNVDNYNESLLLNNNRVRISLGELYDDYCEEKVLV